MSADLLIDKDIKAAYLYKLSIDSLRAKKDVVDFLTPQEAAIVLGIPINTKLKNKLAWLIQNGYIKKYVRHGKDTNFSWEELELLSQEIKESEGLIQIPTTF